jgi:hypothetical protein
MIATSQIKEHMEVLGADGAHVGTVDHMEGEDRIKLTRNDSADGIHHFISVDLVDHVDSQVHLNKSADEVMASWEDENMELEEDTGDLEQADAPSENEWAR